MKQSVKIPLGDWLPDLPSAENPGCEVANNVLPAAVGYDPFPSLVAQGEDVTGVTYGAEQIFDLDGNSVLIGGTSDSLYVRRTAFTETTGLTAIGDGEAWDFAQFNSYVFATANGNTPQYLTDVGSDNTWSALTGSPPSAKRCARVGEFLMLGNIAGDPTKIQWSHYNDPTASWAASRLTQAGSATLPVADGAIQRIVGGRYATVFQVRSVSRLSYVGPPTVFRRDPITTERGAVAPFAVVQVGYLTFFLAQDGFFVTNGSSVDPIGGQRVNKWFFEDVDQSKIKQTHGAVDWQNRCVVWAYKSADNDNFNRLIIYNYIDDKWSTADVDVEWLCSTSLDGIDLDSLDAIYGDLDSIPHSLDSAEFKAKDRRFAAFITGSSGSEYALFTGDPLEANWETGEFQPAPGRRVFVDEVAPIIVAEDWNVQITLMQRDHKGQQDFSATKETGWGGFAPVRGEGQRMAIRAVKPSGDWREATGLDVAYRVTGKR